eukprot:758580-Hanusia_phi.AAC.3
MACGIEGHTLAHRMLLRGMEKMSRKREEVDPVASEDSDSSRSFAGGCEHFCKEPKFLVTEEVELANKKFKPFRAFRKHEGAVQCMALVGNQILCTGGPDKLIKVWDVRTGRCRGTLIGHERPVTDLSARSGKLFSSSSDDSIREWDWEGLREVKMQDCKQGGVRCVMEDGDRIISGGYDGTVNQVLVPGSSLAGADDGGDEMCPCEEQVQMLKIQLLAKPIRSAFVWNDLLCIVAGILELFPHAGGDPVDSSRAVRRGRGVRWSGGGRRGGIDQVAGERRRVALGLD